MPETMTRWRPVITDAQQGDYIEQVRGLIDEISGDVTLSTRDRSRIVDLLRKVEQALLDVKINGALPIEEAVAAAAAVVRATPDLWERVADKQWMRRFGGSRSCAHCTRLPVQPFDAGGDAPQPGPHRVGRHAEVGRDPTVPHAVLRGQQRRHPTTCTVSTCRGTRSAGSSTWVAAHAEQRPRRGRTVHRVPRSPRTTRARA